MDNKELISDEQVVERAQEAVRIDLEKKKVLGISVAVYDRKTKLIYKQNGDGSKNVIGRRCREGRYSERIANKT